MDCRGFKYAGKEIEPLGLICNENMQIEGFWYYLFTGVFEAATIHYAVALLRFSVFVSCLLHQRPSGIFFCIFHMKHICPGGSGTPLLFIHDLTIGSSNYEYHRLINNLTDKHEIYSIDLLGYGLSDKPSMTYTGNIYEQLISDFIKNLFCS